MKRVGGGEVWQQRATSSMSCLARSCGLSGPRFLQSMCVSMALLVQLPRLISMWQRRVRPCTCTRPTDRRRWLLMSLCCCQLS